MTPSLQSDFERLGKRAFGVGFIALVLCLVGVALNRSQFYQSWLVAWIFFGGLSFGALVIFMMQTLTGGAWGAIIRRFCEAAMMTLPLVGVLFLPVIFGAHSLYPWADNAAISNHPEWAHHHGYLNLPFFIVRAVLFFGLLSALAFALRRLSIGRNKAITLSSAAKKTAVLSSGGLVLYVLCMNFASTDWVMSLEPDWYSTVFVVIFMASQFLSALALMTVLLALMANREPFLGVVSSKHFHDLGNLLLAFVIFWTYVSFSQFLIIWSGNLPKEIGWYLHRDSGAWIWIMRLLGLFGFFVPVALLLLRSSKKNKSRLAVIGVMILFANLVYAYWLVMPAFTPGHLRVHWLDFAALFAVGGLWTGMFLWFLKRQPLLSLEIEKEARHE